jgi:hypothetical protein
LHHLTSQKLEGAPWQPYVKHFMGIWVERNLSFRRQSRINPTVSHLAMKDVRFPDLHGGNPL